MRQKIDIAASTPTRPRLPQTMDGLPPLPIQAEMPTFDELLAEPTGQ